MIFIQFNVYFLSHSSIHFPGNPSIILMCGLQGSGKTTFSGKLANFLKTKKGKKPLLVACDIYRPAAINQLHVVGDQIGVEVYSEPENKNAVDIAQNAIKHAKSNGFNVVIVDTAGRLAVDEQMMNEIADLKAAINPSETLFVVDSMTGQDAVNTAKAFDEKINFDGVVLTKLDGDTRGGAAISISDALAAVGLYGYEDTPCYQLSAGQLRRVALARLHLSRARIWILDEPFTAIDKLGVSQLEALIARQSTKGGVVILTSHQDLTLPQLRMVNLQDYQSNRATDKTKEAPGGLNGGDAYHG